jgi:hypothetical protein
MYYLLFCVDQKSSVQAWFSIDGCLVSEIKRWPASVSQAKTRAAQANRPD